MILYHKFCGIRDRVLDNITFSTTYISEVRLLVIGNCITANQVV